MTKKRQQANIWYIYYFTFILEPEYEYYYEYIYEEDLPDFQEKLAPTTTLVTTIPTKETLIENTPIKKFDEPPHTASNGMYNLKQWFLNFYEEFKLLNN